MYFLLLIVQALLVVFEAFVRANISRPVRWVSFLVENISFKKA